jgi:hypothetical protein
MLYVNKSFIIEKLQNVRLHQNYGNMMFINPYTALHS